MRRSYRILIVVNNRKIDELIIDPHYEKKHSGSIDDNVISQLVEQLDGNILDSESEKEPFRYYATNHRIGSKDYRLIWLLENNKSYIGVINAFRR